MVERFSYSVAAPDCSDRSNAYFWTAKTIVMLGHRFLVHPHVEMDEEIAALKRRGGAVFLYCGLHKSLWETSGILPPLHLAGVPLPYIGMGDNLVRGRLFRYLSKKIGAFFVRRPTNRREMLDLVVVDGVARRADPARPRDGKGGVAALGVGQRRLVVGKLAPAVYLGLATVASMPLKAAETPVISTRVLS